MESNTRPLSKTGPGFMMGRRPSIRAAVRPLAFAVIACIIAIVLFSPAGIIHDHADLSFLVAPFICYYILRLCSRLSSIYLPVACPYYIAETASHIFNGLAFSIFCFLFLSNAELLTRVGAFKHIEGFLDYLSATGGYAVIFILGRTVSRVGGIYRGTNQGKPLYPIAAGLGEFFAGMGIWQFLAAFSGAWSPFNELGIMIFAGMLAVAVSNIGFYGENSKNPFIADASHWLQNSQTFEFVIGALIAGYILFIRPFIIDIFRYAPIMEWGIVCFLGWRLFSGIKNGIRTRCAVDVYENDWRKHIQIISNLQGADFPRLREMQEIFIVDSNRGALLVYLTLLLYNNKVSPEEINRILHPLINHRDARIPWLAFGWEQRRILKQNEKNRREILEGIIANLKYIMNPANQKIEEHTDEKTG